MVWYHKVEIWNVNYSLAMPLKQLGLSTKVYAARNGGKESRGPWVSLLDIHISYPAISCDQRLVLLWQSCDGQIAHTFSSVQESWPPSKWHGQKLAGPKSGENSESHCRVGLDIKAVDVAWCQTPILMGVVLFWSVGNFESSGHFFIFFWGPSKWRLVFHIIFSLLKVWIVFFRWHMRQAARGAYPSWAKPWWRSPGLRLGICAWSNRTHTDTHTYI